MEREKLLDVQDIASELSLNADALKSLCAVFGDRFATAREPEKLAEEIRREPDVYTHLWYILFGMVCDIAKAAHKLDDEMSAV